MLLQVLAQDRHEFLELGNVDDVELAEGGHAFETLEQPAKGLLLNVDLLDVQDPNFVQETWPLREGIRKARLDFWEANPLKSESRAVVLISIDELFNEIDAVEPSVCHVQLAHVVLVM